MNQSVLGLIFSVVVFLFGFSFAIQDCGDSKTQFSLFNNTIVIKDKDHELFHLSVDADSVLLSLADDADSSSINGTFFYSFFLRALEFEKFSYTVTLNGQIPFEDFVLQGRMFNSSTAGDVIGSFRPHLESAHHFLLLDCPGGARVNTKWF